MGRGQQAAAAGRRLRERTAAQAAAIAAVARAQAAEERERARRDAAVAQADARVAAAAGTRAAALGALVRACGSVELAAHLLQVSPRQLRALTGGAAASASTTPSRDTPAERPIPGSAGGFDPAVGEPR